MNNLNHFNSEINRIYCILVRVHSKLKYTGNTQSKISVPVNGIDIYQDIHVNTRQAKLLTIANDIYLRSVKLQANTKIYS